MTVYFRDAPGDAAKTIDTGIARLAVASIQTDEFLDNLPPLEERTTRFRKKRLLVDDCVQIFLGRYRDGFDDPAYIGDLHSGERAYKVAAHELYRAELGDGCAERLLEQVEIGELRCRSLRVQGRTNLLFSTEAAAFRDGLPVDSAATQFSFALLRLLSSDTIDGARFHELARAVSSLPAEEDKTSLADALLDKLRPLGACDVIDVQSFMWVVARSEN